MKIQVQLSSEQIFALREIMLLNVSSGLTLEGLVSTFLSDISMAVNRPGSHDGARMVSFLESHGYEI